MSIVVLWQVFPLSIGHETLGETLTSRTLTENKTKQCFNLPDGSEIKGMYYPCEGPEFSSQHPHQAAHNLLCVTPGYMAYSSGFLSHLCVAHTHTHTVKINLQKYMSKNRTSRFMRHEVIFQLISYQLVLEES